MIVLRSTADDTTANADGYRFSRARADPESRRFEIVSIIGADGRPLQRAGHVLWVRFNMKASLCHDGQSFRGAELVSGVEQPPELTFDLPAHTAFEWEASWLPVDVWQGASRGGNCPKVTEPFVITLQPPRRCCVL